MASVTLEVLEARLPAATQLFTTPTGDYKVNIRIGVPSGKAYRHYVAVASPAEAADLIDKFDPDGTLRENAFKNAGLCLYKPKPQS